MICNPSWGGFLQFLESLTGIKAVFQQSSGIWDSKSSLKGDPRSTLQDLPQYSKEFSLSPPREGTRTPFRVKSLTRSNQHSSSLSDSFSYSINKHQLISIWVSFILGSGDMEIKRPGCKVMGAPSPMLPLHLIKATFPSTFPK